MAPTESSKNKENQATIAKFHDVVLPWFEKVAEKGSFSSR
jgi:hypothetical protein